MLLQAFLMVPGRANQQNPTEQPNLCNASNTGDGSDERVGNLCLSKIIVCLTCMSEILVCDRYLTLHFALLACQLK